MPDVNNPSSKVLDQDDSQSPTVSKVPVSGQVTKEQEPSQSADKKEEQILSEIIRSTDAADEEAERKIQEEIQEAKLARPEPIIPSDLAESDIKSPQREANEVIVKGTTIELPISEDEYKKGLHQKIVSIVADKVVVGASSILALVIWVGRIIKIAHKHTMKVIFRKSSFVEPDSTTEDKEGIENAD